MLCMRRRLLVTPFLSKWMTWLIGYWIPKTLKFKFPAMRGIMETTASNTICYSRDLRHDEKARLEIAVVEVERDSKSASSVF
mmetsp:Transcript_23658/g.58002  ORF Transcript_23658/g.58002 Transcript_23658/m.58002 type:complete len:82 (+) Transcript_23658:2173-2418(+)